MKRFSIGIAFFRFLFIFGLFRNTIDSSYIIEPIGIGVEFLSFLDNISDYKDISNHKGDIFLSNNLQLITNGIGIDTKSSIKFNKIIMIKIIFFKFFGL